MPVEGTERRRDYKAKAGLKQDDLRRRREEQQVEIRRQKREDNISKRRNINSVSYEEEELSEEEDAGADADFSDPNVVDASLRALAQEVFANDVDANLQATIKFRKLLSKEVSPPIESVIQTNVVPKFVEFLRGENQMLQFEAAWALTNIASGTADHTRAVMNSGAVPEFIRLLGSPAVDIREQVVWALGNIAGDSPVCRDFVLQSGAMPPLLNLLASEQKLSIIRNATWTLSNFCRGRSPHPEWSLVSPALPTLARLLYSADDEVASDACWAISYLSDGSNDKIQAVIETDNVCTRLIQLLMHPMVSVQTPALRSVGNIVSGDDHQTQTIIACGGLQGLRFLLNSTKDAIRKEVCWSISNITAGSPQQIQAVIEAGLIPPMIELVRVGFDFRTRKEACWALSNATAGGLQEPNIIRYMMSQGFALTIVDFLMSLDVKMIQVAFDALENVLRVGEMDREAAGPGAINQYAAMIEEHGGVQVIHGLQEHENLEIYRKAYDVMDRYFPDDEEDIDAEAAVDASGAYAFESNVTAPQGGFNFGTINV